MRIGVDHDVCSGHGRCAAVAPNVYSLDDVSGNARPLDHHQLSV
jgi:ferredoxin